MKAKNPLKIIFVEDQPADVELAVHELKKSGLQFEYSRVDMREEFISTLSESKPDLVISDYRMPLYNGMHALLDAKEFDPLIPFILYTGSINEETAVECMKAGANDYIIKEHMARLPFAVKESLEQARIQAEKRAADILLKDNENKLQSIFSAAPVGIALLVDNILKEVNDKFCKITGYNRDELIGQNGELIDATIAECHISGFEKFSRISNELNGSSETCVKCKNNTILNVLLSSAPLDRNDPAKGVTLTIMDITESKHAVEELKKLRKAIDSSGEAVFLTDRNGVFTFVNPGFTATYGYEASDVLGKETPRILKSGRLSGDVYQKFWKKLVEGEEVKGELKNKRKNGTIVDIEGSANQILDENNNIIGFLGIQREITKRKLTEEALRKSEEKFRTIMENSADPIFIADTQGKYLYTNKAVTVMLGYTSEEMLTKSIMDITPRDKAKEYFELFNEVLNEGKVLTEIELLKKDGSFISTDLNSVLLPGGLVYGSCRDITGRKQVEEELTIHRDHLKDLVNERTDELIRAKKVAEEANMAKSEFLANMSHEIRTPMNAVLGYTELLSSTVVDSIQKNYINSIISSGRSLLKLINDILDLSKIEAGMLELEYDYVDTYSFFSEFERIFSLKVSGKGLKFFLEISAGTPASICIDESRVRQIVFNLIGNAIKFTSEGKIVLRVFTENPYRVNIANQNPKELLDLVIEIEDTGIGISEEFQHAIFEPFVQGRNNKHHGGTGLGLTITRRLTALMNGTIEIQSDTNAGSIFTVRIPRIAYRSDLSGTEINIQLDPAEIIFAKATILIADDAELNRSFLRDALKNTNLRILEAEDGMAALKIADEIIPDLIIADILMPKLDGFELLNRIKADEKLKHIPVIAYSASVLKGQKELIHHSAFGGLLTKPVNVSELYLCLMNFLKYTSVRETQLHKTISEVEMIGNTINLPGLICSLETTLFDTWKTFAIRQPIAEIHEFGSDLFNLGSEHNSGIIKSYGEDLIMAADSFNIEAILSLIAKYNGIIEFLKESAKSLCNE